MSKKPAIPINPTLPKVSIEVNGATYYLAFDFNALCVAEEATGQNLLQRVFDLRDMPSRTFRAIFYAALLKVQPEMTVEQAGALITPGNFDTIYPKLVEAWLESVPKQDDKSPDPNGETPEAK